MLDGAENWTTRGGKREDEADGIALFLELIYGGRIQSMPANNDSFD